MSAGAAPRRDYCLPATTGSLHRCKGEGPDGVSWDDLAAENKPQQKVGLGKVPAALHAASGPLTLHHDV